MTVLEVTAVPFSPRFRGGGESYPWFLSMELAKFEKVVRCVSVPEPDPSSGPPATIVPAFFLNFPPLFSEANPLPGLRSFNAIKTLLEDSSDPIEFVHVHNLRTAMSTAWLLLSKLNRVEHKFKILLTDHNARWFPFPRLTSGCADYYVPVSEESRSMLNGYAVRPSVTIPTGVPSDYPGLLRPLRPWESRDTDLLFFGRLAPWKRPDLTIRLARDLAEVLGRELTVVIAGSEVEPSFTSWLHRAASSKASRARVRFVSNPSVEEAAKLLAGSKLHTLFSSRLDAFGRANPVPELSPTTVVEAAACGTPTISSDFPGARQQILEGQTGYVKSLRDWAGIVAVAAGLLNSPEAWNVLSARCRYFVTTERTYKVLAERLAAFLSEIRAGTV